MYLSIKILMQFIKLLENLWVLAYLWLMNTEQITDGSKMMQYTNITKTIIPKEPTPVTGANVAKARKMEAQQPTYCMPGPNPTTGASVAKARKMEAQQPIYCMPAQLSSSNLTTQPSTTQQAAWTGTKASEIYRTQCMDCPGPFQTTVNTHLPTYTLLNPVSHVGLIFSSEKTFWARQDQDMLIFNQQWNVQHTNYWQNKPQKIFYNNVASLDIDSLQLIICWFFFYFHT